MVSGFFVLARWRATFQLGWFGLAWLIPGLCPAAEAPRSAAQPTAMNMAVLSQVAQVRGLSESEAERRHPVHIRGVVTFYDPSWGVLFVQDATGGIFVRPPSERLPLTSGSLVDLEGVSGPGSFAPIILEPRISVTGQGPLPSPPVASWPGLVTGRRDGQWVRIGGIVRSVTEEDGHANLEVSVNGGRVKASLPGYTGANLPSHLLDARVQLQGVCASRFNPQPQLKGVRLLVPSLTNVIVQEPAPANPFATPVEPIKNLKQLGPEPAIDHRLHIQGMVTHQLPSSNFYIKDDSGSILIQTRQQTRLQSGERVDALGFPATVDGHVVLQDAAFRSLGLGRPATPEAVSEPELFENDHHGELVQIDGMLLDSLRRPDGLVLAIQEANFILDAQWQTTNTSVVLPSLGKGSRLRLTGICSVRRGDSGEQFIRILLRTPADIVVLKRASWWTPARAGKVLSVLGVGILAALGWIISLRSRMRLSDITLHTLVEASPLAVIATDRKSRITVWNQAAAQLYGWPATETLGRELPFIPEEKPGEHQDLYRRILQGESFHEIERRCHTKDGLTVDVRMSGAPLRNGDGAIVGAVAFTADISERKKAEETLRLNEARLDALVRLAQMQNASLKEIVLFALEEGVRLTKSRIGYVAFTNDDETVLTMYAWSGEAMKECAIKDKPLVYPIEKTGLWGEAIRQRKPVVTNDYAAPNPCKKGTPDGHVRMDRHMNVPIFDGPHIVAVAGVGNKVEAYDGSDIGQLTLLMEGMWNLVKRKRSEDALRQSEARLVMSQRIGKVGSWELDLRNQELIWSGETYRIFGLERGSAKPTRDLFFSMIHPDDRALVTQARETALAGEAAYGIDHRIVWRDETERFVHEEAEVVWDDQHQPLKMVGTVQDITERKQLEAQLRQAQKMEAIGQLAGGVAHDFNNILTVILGHVGLLVSRNHWPADILDSIKQIGSSADRAANLTRQLLAFSRRQVLQMRWLDLNELLANVAKMLQRLLGEHIALEFHFGPDLPGIEADPGMIEQIVINLAVNARDAMPKGGKLLIGTSQIQVEPDFVERNPECRAGRFLCLAVEDTGCGMSQAVLNRLFEPFFTTKEVGKGTGLGLATVYGIVKQHQGWIDVNSAVGQGSIFRIFLPISAHRAAPPTERPYLAEVTGGKERILVVEDEPSLRHLVSACLRHQGYQVWEAANGIEALKIWQQHRHQMDLLLTDMVMPEGLTGLELAEQLRRDNSQLKVIYTSGYSVDLATEGLSLDEGMNYLQKPFEPATLVKTIRACLDQKPSVA